MFTHQGFAQIWRIVVNRFQIVSLIYWCSLLELLGKISKELWIGFKLYLWFIDVHCIIKRARFPGVVNRFQIVSLIYWCSLNNLLWHTFPPLWIGFKLYLWFIDVHSNITSISFSSVVNRFQIVSLIYWYSLATNVLLMEYGLWIGFKLYLWFIDIH